MKRTIEILRRMRATVLLHAVLLTSLSAHAKLTCIASPSDVCGTVKAEGTLVYVTPAAGYYISAVTYDNGKGTNMVLAEIAMPAGNTDTAGTVCFWHRARRVPSLPYLPRRATRCGYTST